MKKNFIRLTCLVMVAVIGIGAAFAADGSTTGGWSTGAVFSNGGETTLNVSWGVDLDRETYEVGYMSNTDPTTPAIISQLPLEDSQKGDVFKGVGSVNVYWNIFSRQAFTVKLNVTGPLTTVAQDPEKQGPNDGKINWQVKFLPKEVDAEGQIVPAGSYEKLIGSVDKGDYAEGYNNATPIFTQVADINKGEKRKSSYTTVSIETQDIGDNSKINGAYAGTLTLTVESV